MGNVDAGGEFVATTIPSTPNDSMIARLHVAVN